MSTICVYLCKNINMRIRYKNYIMDVDMSGAPTSVDISGVSVTAAAPAPAPAPASAPVPVSEPAPASAPVPVSEPAPASAPVPVSEPAPASAPEITPAQTAAAAPVTLTKELSDAVDGIVRDLSGLNVSNVTVADLIRFVPRLSSLVHTLQIRGSEKRELVMAAAHVLVSRVIPESHRESAHALVDTIFPPAIAAVIDVVAGRVTFEQAVQSAAVPVTVAVVQQGCLSRCLRKN